MKTNAIDLAKLMRLAYLNPAQADEVSLNNDVLAIINFVDELSKANTDNIPPLFNPFDLPLRFRPDEVSETSCLLELEAIAPLFDNGAYCVPKVIDNEK